MQMVKQTKPDSLIRLRKLINEGFKEYDGDIREEALELLTDIELIYKTATENFEVQASDVDELIKENKELKSYSESQSGVIRELNVCLNNVSRSRYNIEHGTGKMNINVAPGSSVLWEELAKSIADAVKTVPLQAIISAINNISPRF